MLVSQAKTQGDRQACKCGPSGLPRFVHGLHLVMISFIEAKRPDMSHVAQLLGQCAAANHWANGGPLWHRLADDMARHMALPDDRRLVPCANAGIALEALARLHDRRAGRRLRWAMPSFAFRNLGRGYFTDGPIVDCDDQGMIDTAALAALPDDSLDGVIAVNPLGHARDFGPVIAFARARGLPLLLDNAAGVGTAPPDWPWQVFSLHHTKPYGMGEGGLALLPNEAAAEFQALIGYGDAPEPASAWLNNGKLSDIACAFLIDRLADAPNWIAASAVQRARILRLARPLGLSPLAGGGVDDVPLTSLALLADGPLDPAALTRARHFAPAKYYKPLAATPQAGALFARIVNIPCHPTMAQLSDDQIAADLARIVQGP